VSIGGVDQIWDEESIERLKENQVFFEPAFGSSKIGMKSAGVKITVFFRCVSQREEPRSHTESLSRKFTEHQILFKSAFGTFNIGTSSISINFPGVFGLQHKSYETSPYPHARKFCIMFCKTPGRWNCVKSPLAEKQGGKAGRKEKIVIYTHAKQHKTEKKQETKQEK
jgi:hypothetical protein